MPFELDFISEKNFEEHVKNTIKTYNKSLEAIDPKSRNIPWGCSVNGQHVENESIRRVSMDKFYAIDRDIQKALYKLAFNSYDGFNLC